MRAPKFRIDSATRGTAYSRIVCYLVLECKHNFIITQGKLGLAEGPGAP
eukprot:SAG31_NODE_3624_length_4058_cov_2.587270_4_plen_49_part_00